MSGWSNIGLVALMEAASSPLTAASVFHAGFVLGPRINAGGRSGRSDLGARLLSTDDPAEAADLAAQLHALNAQRREVEQQLVEDAIESLERSSNFNPDQAVIVAAGEGWHPGVIGIVASRLRERYRKPAVVIGIDSVADAAKGSGRSQPGMNLGAAVSAAFEQGLLMAGGGHAMAAGLTIRPAMIPAFREFLEDRLAPEREASAGSDAMEIDALVAPAAVNRALYEEFQQLAPFGPGNPEPVFAMDSVRIERPMALKGGHVRVTLTSPSGDRVKAVAWRSAETELGARLMAGGSLHVAGRLKPDDWQGRAGVELEIDDAADPRMR